MSRALMPQIPDGHCDPRSGGIAGHAHICSYYGVDKQQFKRYIAGDLDYLVWLGDIPITHVSSVQADCVTEPTSMHSVERVCGRHCRCNDRKSRARPSAAWAPRCSDNKVAPPVPKSNNDTIRSWYALGAFAGSN